MLLVKIHNSFIQFVLFELPGNISNPELKHWLRSRRSRRKRRICKLDQSGMWGWRRSRQTVSNDPPGVKGSSGGRCWNVESFVTGRVNLVTDLWPRSTKQKENTDEMENILIMRFVQKQPQTVGTFWFMCIYTCCSWFTGGFVPAVFVPCCTFPLHRPPFQ